ncbi:hypothetical protein TNCV_688181 [Trichonephila clavipes]|nr:hypothetical protein TNCV_688181 [Trichonephila clavipes]
MGHRSEPAPVNRLVIVDSVCCRVYRALPGGAPHSLRNTALIDTAPATSSILCTSVRSSNKDLSSSTVPMFSTLPPKTSPVLETITTSNTIPSTSQAPKRKTVKNSQEKSESSLVATIAVRAILYCMKQTCNLLDYEADTYWLSTLPRSSVTVTSTEPLVMCAIGTTIVALREASLSMLKARDSYIMK